MIPEGRTARLLLRPLQLADAPQIQRLFPRWEIVKYLAAKVPWPYPPDGAECFIRDGALPQMQRGEAWHWTLRLPAQPDRIIGFISLVVGEDENRGFWLDPAHRGHGYMTEACSWANDFWFDTLGQSRLRAPKAVANTASRRISRRMGMHMVRTEERDFVSGRLPSEIWEITADEWRAWKAAHPAGVATPRRKPAKSAAKRPAKSPGQSAGKSAAPPRKTRRNGSAGPRRG
jgi:RimJ/RimL family protein N-acetyltransferase